MNVYPSEIEGLNLNPTKGLDIVIAVTIMQPFYLCAVAL